MDILGIGFPELVFIFIIAIMVFGPRRLPEIAAKVGKTIADLRSMSQGLLAEWQREITVAARLDELEELKRARAELEEAKQVLKQSQKDVASEVTQTKETIGTMAPPAHPSRAASSPDITKSKSEQDRQESAEEISPAEESVSFASGSSPAPMPDVSSPSQSDEDKLDTDQPESEFAQEDSTTELEVEVVRQMSSTAVTTTSDSEKEPEITEMTPDPASADELLSQTEKDGTADSASLKSVPTTLTS